jgi:isopentenyl diphosphate isomerase/L-lactate dehydrogenase-like FMN-dependent dehydrogenase
VTSGPAAAGEAIDAVVRELAAAMLLTGSADLAALRATKRVITGELARWIEQLA